MNEKVTTNGVKDGRLYIGWAIEDITPDGPASLYGQYYERISAFVESPLKVTACAIESTDENGVKEQAIMVSMDLLCPLKALQDKLKGEVKSLIPDFDVRKLFLNATHTHSAPYPDVESDYGKLLLQRLIQVVVLAWNQRTPAGVSSAYGYAVVGHNRRVQYADGTTEMYGDTARTDFIGLEASVDTGVGMLYCWDVHENLTGIIMNVACPAQVTESKYYVSADYWGEVRKQLNTKYDRDIFVLAQCGAAGDISPRDLPKKYKVGEPNMWDIPGIIEIGKRLVKTIEDFYPAAKSKIETTINFKHTVKDIQIPTRRVSEKEYNEALRISAEIHSREPKDKNSPETAWNRFLIEVKDNEKKMQYGPWDNKNSDYGIVRKKDAVIEQYKNQERNLFYNMELHVIRLGEVVIASNSFELFVDYGFRITARSKASQTFIVQLSCDYGDYLATEKALEGGGYSAMANAVGADGGEVLVNETVNLINAMWE
jgi:hypothetical protein